MVDNGQNSNNILQEIADALITGNATKVGQLTTEAVQQNISAKDILDKGLISGMNVIGVRFKNSECYVPEVLIAAKAMHTGMNIIKPILIQKGSGFSGKVVIGTVAGDMHDIGKNLVGMLLEGAGFEIIDLGIDTAPSKFVDAVKREKPNFVALSALLTTTTGSMRDTIQALEMAGIRDKVKILVGGAPVTQKFADQIGADGFAPDAASAVDKAKVLLT